jgi:hypothetical protein
VKALKKEADERGLADAGLGRAVESGEEGDGRAVLLRNSLINSSVLRASQDRTTLTQGNSWTLVDDGVFESSRRVLYPKRVGAPATAFTCFASLVFPVLFAKKGDIDPPDHYNLPGLQAPRLVDRITPDYVPSGVVVVRL